MLRICVKCGDKFFLITQLVFYTLIRLRTLCKSCVVKRYSMSQYRLGLVIWNRWLSQSRTRPGSYRWHEVNELTFIVRSLDDRCNLRSYE